ncbi:hypothetical protein ACTU6V_06505 [Microbacterium sp. A204]|uniref:hypothetical protein n=1 Tax=Microbacterium sp. A204 TaxID=3457321 RepID=UPI003FD36F58
MCAPDLTVDQAIVMIDALVTPALNHPDLGPGKPMATLSEIEARLLIIDSGLPEPVVQFEVRVEGELIARPDLAYPELKVGIEYDGDGHRTDKDEWRRDIQRHRALTAAGWVSLHLTEADLAAGARDAFVAQLRRAMAERRMEITAQTASKP